MTIICGMSLAINFRSLIPRTSLDLFDADDLNMLSYPLGGKIDPPAIPALFDLFLNHLFAVDLKLGFSDELRFFHQGRDIRILLSFPYHHFERPTGVHNHKLVTT